MADQTLYERVAYSLAVSSVVGSRMDYDQILAYLHERFPDERALQVQSLVAFQDMRQACRSAIGVESDQSFDEWLDEAKAVYEERQKELH